MLLATPHAECQGKCLPDAEGQGKYLLDEVCHSEARPVWVCRGICHLDTARVLRTLRVTANVFQTMRVIPTLSFKANVFQTQLSRRLHPDAAVTAPLVQTQLSWQRAYGRSSPVHLAYRRGV